jgi:uroporphyrinogen III methyltransferase / synthase
MTGFVSLIGAGPGDPGLITAKGLDRLRVADVLVFDALVNPRLLTEARAGARLIDVGKRGGDHKLTQDQTNQLLVELAGEGLAVVRLKGGDPYLFGRGAEEAAYLARHGVECEVVPGITSGIAAPAYAGIPVTHRKVASTVTFVTGHEQPGKAETAVDYKSLAGLISVGGTVCFYMGIGQLPRIVASLVGHGLDAGTAAAVVQWGTRTKQRSVRGRLDEIVHLIEEAGIGSPAIILVGEVAGLDEPGLDYFTSRPLFGQRVLVTRTRQQASGLSAQLEALGAEVLEAPTIEVVPAKNLGAVDEAIVGIGKWDWLVLTSPNAVGVLADRMSALGLDARHLAGVKIASVAEATSGSLSTRLGVRADFVPVRTMGEGLAEELIEKEGVSGRSVLLLRADIARPALPRLLGEAGADVRELVVYETRIAGGLPGEVMEALRAGGIDWVTFTSSSTASNLVGLLGEERGLLDGVKTASIGPMTSGTMRGLGLGVTVEALESSVGGLVEAMKRGEG